MTAVIVVGGVEDGDGETLESFGCDLRKWKL